MEENKDMRKIEYLRKCLKGQMFSRGYICAEVIIWHRKEGKIDTYFFSNANIYRRCFLDSGGTFHNPIIREYVDITGHIQTNITIDSDLYVGPVPKHEITIHAMTVNIKHKYQLDTLEKITVDRKHLPEWIDKIYLVTQSSMQLCEEKNKHGIATALEITDNNNWQPQQNAEKE